MIRASRLLLVLLLGATLLACSSLSYRAADIWLRWQLNGLVSLERAQEGELEQRLSSVLDWHRREQLPRYRQWLETVRGELAQPALAPEQWQLRSDELGAFWLDAMAHLQPEALALLGDLSDEQVAELVASLREQQAEAVDKWSRYSADELQARRQKRMERQLKRWVGRLDDTQRSLVAQWAVQLGDSRGERIEQRRLWLDDFEAALQRRGEREWFDAELEALMLRPEQRWHAAYREAVGRNSRVTIELLQALHASLSDRQRQHLDKRIGIWIDRFERLAATSSPPVGG
jgi:hypothetical protein